MSSVDERAQVLARRQLGVATRRQLREHAGVSPRTITRRLAAGRWREPLPGVLDLGAHPPSWHRSVWQLLLAAGEPAWVSHRTAAHLHGFLDVRRPHRIDVLVPRSRHAAIGGVRLHTTVSLAGDEVTTVGGLPCTSAARTLLDLAGTLLPDDLERIALDLGRRRSGVLERASALADRRRGVAGRRRLLAVLRRLPADVARIESPLEVRGVQALVQGSIPAPRLQYRVRDHDGAVVKRVDAAWPDRRVAVEFDGAAYHDLLGQRSEDAWARDRLRALGWEVVVIRATELEEPALTETLRRIRAAVT